MVPCCEFVTLSALQHINVFEPLHFFELVMLHGYRPRILFIHYKIQLRIKSLSKILAVIVM